MSEREVKLGYAGERVGTSDKGDVYAGGFAADDDATEALEGLVWAIYNLRHGPNSEYAVYARYVDTYLGAVGKTHDGAALIRQAMNRPRD